MPECVLKVSFSCRRVFEHWSWTVFSTQKPMSVTTHDTDAAQTFVLKKVGNSQPLINNVVVPQKSVLHWTNCILKHAKQSLYSRDLNTKLVWYSGDGFKFVHQIVCYASHELNNKQWTIIRHLNYELKVCYSSHDLKKELLVRYSGHGLNNELSIVC